MDADGASRFPSHVHRGDGLENVPPFGGARGDRLGPGWEFRSVLGGEKGVWGGKGHKPPLAKARGPIYSPKFGTNGRQQSTPVRGGVGTSFRKGGGGGQTGRGPTARWVFNQGV